MQYIFEASKDVTNIFSRALADHAT
ncbi:hypothetical protein [Fortiea contorta]